MKKLSLAQILYESDYVVCLTGREMIVEAGIDSMKNMETAYEIELKYGYSPEELFSAQFFSTRTELFYQFYREEVLAQDKEPGRAYAALAELEKMGVLKSTITRQLYNFSSRAGCNHVFDLHGNIYEKNHCPRCFREYPLSYIKAAGKFPVCESCGIPIHPGVVLHGEMVDIGLATRAADEVARADTLLLAGTSMRADVVLQFKRYFQGKRIVLVHAEEHFADREADNVIIGKAAEVLPLAVEELKAMKAVAQDIK